MNFCELLKCVLVCVWLALPVAVALACEAIEGRRAAK